MHNHSTVGFTQVKEVDNVPAEAMGVVGKELVRVGPLMRTVAMSASKEFRDLGMGVPPQDGRVTVAIHRADVDRWDSQHSGVAASAMQRVRSCASGLRSLRLLFCREVPAAGGEVFPSYLRVLEGFGRAWDASTAAGRNLELVFEEGVPVQGKEGLLLATLTNSFPQLRSLTLHVLQYDRGGGSAAQWRGALSALLQGHPGLDELRLTLPSLPVNDGGEMLPSPLPGQITQLHVKVGVWPHLMGGLFALVAASDGLVSLSLDGDCNPEDVAQLASLRSLRNLSLLHIGPFLLHEMGGALTSLTQITQLVVDRNGVESFKWVRGLFLPGLRSIELRSADASHCTAVLKGLASECHVRLGRPLRCKPPSDNGVGGAFIKELCCYLVVRPDGSFSAQLGGEWVADSLSLDLAMGVDTLWLADQLAPICERLQGLGLTGYEDGVKVEELSLGPRLHTLSAGVYQSTDAGGLIGCKDAFERLWCAVNECQGVVKVCMMWLQGEVEEPITCAEVVDFITEWGDMGVRFEVVLSNVWGMGLAARHQLAHELVRRMNVKADSVVSVCREGGGVLQSCYL